jgi:hypothetical protein
MPLEHQQMQEGKRGVEHHHKYMLQGHQTSMSHLFDALHSQKEQKTNPASLPLSWLVNTVNEKVIQIN